MTNVSSSNVAVSRLSAQADAIARLAQDSGGFSAVVAAFESQDANAFRWVLGRLEMLPYCELICEWVRIKLCALRCAEICRPVEQTDVPSLQQFARAVVELSSNEKALRRVVDSMSCGDGSEYHAALAELKLSEFCQLLCHWVCSIGYDRVCEIVCRPQPVPVSDPAIELHAAGRVLAELVKNEKALNTIANATVALDCATLQSAINEAGLTGGCEVICRLICVWRCVWVCRELCEVRPPILAGAHAIEEARTFALTARQLASHPRVLGDLVTAVQTRNASAYRAIVDRFGLGPYCWQVCAWVCSIACREFCTCVCPPPGEVPPLFTNVGCYQVGPPVSDFNLDGTTISGSLAFTGMIPLIGTIPDGSAPVAIEYRFTYQQVSPTVGPLTNITGPMIPPTQIGKLVYWYWDGTGWTTGSTPYTVNGSVPTVSIPQQFGLPLIVAVNVNADAQGWIQIPQQNDYIIGGTGLFTPDGAQGLILLDTTQLTLEKFDLTGLGVLPELEAGDTVPPAALSQKPIFKINFEAQTVATSTPVGSNSLNAIALSNTQYTYNRHPEWPGPPTSPVTTQPWVLSVDIAELDSGGGCTKLDDVIHVLYTAYHPYLGSCTVYLQGPGVASMTTPPGGSISPPIQPNAGQVIGTGDGATVTFTGTLTTPVLPGSVRITAGAIIGNDNGAGGVSGAGIAAGSVNYGTGAVSITYSVAPGAGVSVLVVYNTNVSSGAAGRPFDMTGLTPCAYIIWLSASLNLTSGLACCGSIGSPFPDYIPFCTS